MILLKYRRPGRVRFQRKFLSNSGNISTTCQPPSCAWALKHEIRDRTGKLYHFTAHQFRHTVGMRLINDDVPLEVISRLLGHRSLWMTQVYARVKDKKMRADLERAARKRKTVDYQGNAVKGDPRAND